MSSTKQETSSTRGSIKDQNGGVQGEGPVLTLAGSLAFYLVEYAQKATKTFPEDLGGLDAHSVLTLAAGLALAKDGGVAINHDFTLFDGQVRLEASFQLSNSTVN